MTRNESKKGVLFALAAFSFWGVVPIYFRFLAHVSPLEIIAHRVIWTVLLLGVLLTLAGQAKRFLALLRPEKRILLLTTSALLLTMNWLVFVWAVSQERILETSLGYFINPLVNVLLGMVFLGERLRRMQQIAVALAAAGVLYLVIDHGALPWISLVLPISFGLYGFIRKQVDVESLHGLLIEMLVLFPFAGMYLGYLLLSGGGSFLTVNLNTDALLLLAGPFTVIPLGCFAAGARRITLSTLGFIQYLAPTLTFFVAVFLYQEPFSGAQLVTFSCIWISLAIFSVDGYRASRMRV